MKRSPRRIILLLFCIALLWNLPASATPVSSTGKSYAAAMKAAEELRADSQKATRRDRWEQVIQRFAHIEKTTATTSGQKELTANSIFQQATLWEELGNKSFNVKDWRKAIATYARLADKYPQHTTAPQALLRSASIEEARLKNNDAAKKTLDRLIRQYPKSKEYAAATALRNGLGKNTGSGRTTPPLPTPGSAQGKAAPPVLPATRPGQSPPQPTPRISLQQSTWQGSTRQGTLTLTLSQETSFRYQYLAAKGKEPAFLQLDLESTLSGPGVTSTTAVSSGPASRVRVLGLGGESTRVLIELKNISYYKVTPFTNPPRVVVHVGSGKAPAGSFKVPAKRQNDLARAGSFTGASQKPGTLVEQLGLTVRTIMLDPGHGGKDPGAMGNGLRESHITLRMAKMVGQLLIKKGFTVIYTRENDRYLSLEQRPVIANNKKADLFISIHVNANPDPEINGVESYFLDLARSSSAATVAARENAVSVKSISDLQFILADLMLSSKLQESRELAGMIHGRGVNRLQRAGYNLRDNGVRSAPFYVLMGARMPAVLVEIGYLTNSDDAARLKSDKYLERLAEGVCDGVVAYQAKISRFASSK